MTLIPVKAFYCQRIIVFSFLFFITHSFAYSQSWLLNGTNLYYNGGNVGINTSTPLEKLQIGDRWTFQDGGWKGINYNMAWNTFLNTNARIVTGPTAAFYFTNTGSIIFENGPANNAGTRADDALWSMVISNSGQVGIGPASPSAKLDVSWPASTSPQQGLLLHSGSFMNATNAVNSYFLKMVDDGNGVAQFIVKGDGTVGIGTTSTGSNKLAVEGTIAARKVVVTLTNPFPDYVFNKNYQLLSLKNLEKFIQINKHLPDMPSADSVAKDGLDVGNNQAALLKKIEELTLYIIKQNKKIESLTNRVQSLEKTNKQ